MRHSRKHPATLIIVAMLVPSLALGQTAPPAQPTPPAAAPMPAPAVAAKPLSETLQGTAKAAYDAGKLLYGDGDFKGAKVKFQAAFDESKDPRLLWNMAACEEKLRHYAKAVTDIERYLTESGTQITDQDRAEAKQLHDTLQGFTAAITLKINEPDADVSIDGEVVGKSPLAAPAIIDIGEHGVLVHKDGFTDFAKTIQVSGPGALDIQLAREMHEGRLDVKAPDGAEIKIDGQSVGVGTWSGPLSSGGHQLSVSAPGMRTAQSEVVLQDSQTRSVDVALEPEASHGLPAWVWAVTGVVVVGGLAVGGYFAFRKQDTTGPGTPGTMDPGTVQVQFR
jgi:hypothetical protein